MLTQQIEYNEMNLLTVLLWQQSPYRLQPQKPPAEWRVQNSTEPHERTTFWKVINKKWITAYYILFLSKQCSDYNWFIARLVEQTYFVNLQLKGFPERTIRWLKFVKEIVS